MFSLLLFIAHLLSVEPNDTISVVKPGDGTVSGRNIPAYKNSWEMTAVNLDGSVTYRGIWNDEISFVLRNGNEVLRREQHVYYNDKEAIQLDEVDRQTLMPIYINIRSVGQDPHTEIHYDGKKIFGKKIFNIEGLDTLQKLSAPFSYELPEPVFDWHLWGVLISGFPLEQGYRARFLAHESYSYLPGDFRWFTLRVTGQEIIDGGKWGHVNCWTVEVKAEVVWRLWISVRKDIAPVQQIRIDDASGVQYWWKPRSSSSVPGVER